MTDLVAEIRAVPRPAPVMDRDREEALTPRQRELLDGLIEVFDEGFGHVTMADLAGRLGCSLRTLYQLAPSRDELVLIVIDRNLRRIGRAAQQALDPTASALSAVSTYLHAANDAVTRISEPFARDMARLPAAVELASRHEAYLVDVSTRLLDRAVEAGEIPAVDTRTVARAAASMGRVFAQPGVVGQTRSNPKAAANLVVDLLVAGLRSSR